MIHLGWSNKPFKLHIIVVYSWVNVAIDDPGSPSQFAGRGQQGSMSQFRMGRRPVAEFVEDGVSPKTRWVAAPCRFVVSTGAQLG
jgi:hypothetical protein